MSVPVNTDAPISDYGFLSDCRSAALVGRGGSVDWWCPARFDSPSVFGRLLDPDAGHWRLAPTAQGHHGYRTERDYLPGTLVLRTVHHTDSGSVAVTDALAIEPGARGHDLGRRSPAVLLRVVEGLTGSVRMRTEFVPRPEYGLLAPYVHHERGRVVAAAGPATLTLSAPVSLHCERGDATAEFDVAAGQVVEFELAYAPAYGPAVPGDDPARRASVADTAQAWRSLGSVHSYRGRYAAQVRRSALVLQGLTYVPSGTLVAAATTSLPEDPGGSRNYDYRYAWLRDFAFTMQALWVAACPDETSRLFAWAARSAGRIGSDPIQIMYGVEGERDLTEHSLAHLRGYANSRPVRVGNDAWGQRQLDVPGEIFAATKRLSDQLGAFDDELRAMLIDLADGVAGSWREPDCGMWEERGTERQFLSSKVMAWLALDRAVQLAPKLGTHGQARVSRWSSARDEVRAMVLAEGWNERLGAYVGVIGTDELDASALIMPLTGFLPAAEPRMRSTIEVIESRLGSDGLIRRWSGDPAAFVLCTFWLVECLDMIGKRERAEALFERTLARSNDLGLFAEQIDPASGQHLGNTPQALSHVGLINAAWQLTQPNPVFRG
ncbi:glycoside hydrolase family 15 protein [Micromonospora sp. NBC_01699]|uniref:glycoside hydrolase family 15 protein n=1 Tax=Micromonospora sp. NBC_01699 TaxID=2975984 RepID=UPI002E327847|nr:glycoside hydrolase family 15 protein [Micromonospora sp. NBC_01699]